MYLCVYVYVRVSVIDSLKYNYVCVSQKNIKRAFMYVCMYVIDLP